MELCSEGHDEICFEGDFCPACNLRYEMQQEIDKLELELYNAE